MDDTQYINEMIDVIMKVARGDYSAQIQLSEQNDLLDSLAMGLNMMIDDIRNSYKELKSTQNATLNILEDLDQRGKELEALNKQLLKEITERKRAEEELNKTFKELERSNKELEQFAYVASHDLQEPLRMVVSYLQLLERRYKNKLDSEADEFIAFAVDGAKRMQRLINDLLSYSRVTTKGKEFKTTDSETILNDALSNLGLMIEDSGAAVTHDPLPSLIADDVQLGQMFQNLVGNAIKFHGEKPPKIHVSVDKKENEWIFSVKDNGIGIDPEFADDAFMIFQRLQSQDDYPGTGIGLAVCKRIVERHNGRIWFDSEPGNGTTFYFSIPILDLEGDMNG